jgi:hypothetical protein
MLAPTPMTGRKLLDEPYHRPQEEAAAEQRPPAGQLAGIVALQQAAGNVATRALLRQPAPPAPAKPKTDEEIWEEDWNDPDLKGARQHFAGPDRPTGDPHFRYMHLAPLYKAKGIARPLQWANDNIVTGWFYGHSSPMHKDLRTALKTAETELKKTIPDAPFKKLWAYNPRTQTGGQWSNHADGKAVDFDEVTNPRLLSGGDRAVITAVTGMDISAANPGAGQGMSSYDASKEASDRFQARYTDEGLAERADELGEEADTLTGERDALSEAIAAIPTGKKKGEAKPTADQKADLKRLSKELAAKKAELAAAQASKKTVEKELARKQALEKAVMDALTEATELSAAVDVLEAEVSTLEGGGSLTEGEAPLEGKALKKAVDTRKAQIKAKSAQWKIKDAVLKKKLKAQEEDTLGGYAERGFLDLDERLVDELRKAGLRWGGDYAGAKDFMHFEVV